MLASLQMGYRLCVGVTLMAVMTGCAHEDNWGPLPPPPVGSDSRAFQQRQINAALADRLTVYRHEWTAGGDQLGDYGNRHAEEIAELAGRTDRPVLIEQDADAGLNESRRDFLVRYLTDHRIDDAEHRVVVGRPSASGIPGDEAIEIFNAKPSSGQGGGEGRGASRTGAGVTSGGSF